jgi:hypothetical protein
MNIFEKYKQLENSVTHGFVSVLKSIDENVARHIIYEAFGITMSSGLIFDFQTPSYKNKQVLSLARKGYLVGISSPSSENDINSDEVTDQATKSIPDGWICDGETIILIEAKLNSSFSKKQLESHKKILEEYCEFEKQLFRTWQNVDDTIKKFVKNQKELSIQESILSEYRRYLQLSGLTIDFEKFFNPQKYDIKESWFGDESKNVLRLMKNKILGNIGIHEDKKKNNQVNETNVNYYWLRLYDKSISNPSINWRWTLYLNPDGVNIDILAFNPNQRAMKPVLDYLIAMTKTDMFENQQDRLRLWFYITQYGLRRSDAQKGRNYEFCSFNYNIGMKPTKLDNSPDELVKLAKSIEPKQLGLKYIISNPGSGTKKSVYWENYGKGVNYDDARLLRDPEEVIKRFVRFFNLTLDVLRS